MSSDAAVAGAAADIDADKLRWFIDAKVDDEQLDFSSRAMEHRSIKSETGIIAGVGVGYDSNIADRAGFKFEEVQNTIEKRRRERGLVVRERKKPGRKPLGPVAMSGAERKRKHDRIKRLQALVTPERRQAGVDQPLPLRRSAPVNLSRKDRKV